MKDHQINSANNANYPGPSQEKQTPELQLVIVPLPEDFEKVADPEALKFRSTSWTARELPWERVDGAEWSPTGDEEVANVMNMRFVESITEESYRRFSRVVLPLFGGLYGFFSRQETPPLNFIKQSFRNHMAVAQYWRHKESDDELPSLGSKSRRTISEGLAQTIQGAMAELTACECLGISPLWHQSGATHGYSSAFDLPGIEL